MPEVEQELQAFLDRELGDRPGLVVLDAGCGSHSDFEVRGARRVGIDISAKQLARNPRLDQRILGDLQSFDLPPAAYDVILCWDVLEHLERPDAALTRFAVALRAGGLIVIGVPNLFSIKGVVTRLTPHRLHVWFYRHLFRLPLAGTGDWGPYPTHLRLAIAPPRLLEFARRQGLEVAWFRLYESRYQLGLRRRFFAVRLMLGGLALLTRVLTLNRLDGMQGDCIVVMRKPAAAALMRTASASKLLKEPRTRKRGSDERVVFRHASSEERPRRRSDRLFQQFARERMAACAS